MPDDSPPEVKFDDGAWHVTEWDPSTLRETVQQGDPELEPDAVEYLHVTVFVSDEPGRVCRLLCAGPDVSDDDAAGAVRLERGAHLTRVRVRRGRELIVREAEPVVVA